MYADSCGGQNRSIKQVMLLSSYLAKHPSLKTITLRFFESGHSFNDCDRDFAFVEKVINSHEFVYSFPHLMKILNEGKGNKKVHCFETVSLRNIELILI